MAACQVCGNEYDQVFEVRLADGTAGTFDSFECAIHAFAPRCSHCGCMVIGHGTQSGDSIFCCAHCADQMGHPEMVDRSPEGSAVS